MAEREHRVLYRAVADFSAVIREARKARREIEALKAAEAALGADTGAGDTRAATARRRSTRATVEATDAIKDFTEASKKADEASARSVEINRTLTDFFAKIAKAQTAKATAAEKDAVASNEAASASEKLESSSKNLAVHFTRINEALLKKAAAAKKDEEASEGASRATRKLGDDSSATGRAVSSMTSSLAGLSTGARRAASDVDRLGDSSRRAGSGGGGSGLRRLASDANSAFVSMSRLGRISLLATIFGAVGAAINPVIAALGTLVPLALAAANALGTLAGSAGALLPGLAAAATGVGALMVAFSGIGATLKAYTAAQKAAGKAGASSANSQVDQARRIQDAQDRLADARLAQTRAAEDSARRIEDAEESLARSLKNTRRAQEDLNKARQEALKDLIELREEVSRGSLDEEGARARLLKAQEDYMRSLADPDQTAADRATALYELHQAEQDLRDVQEKRVDDAKKLAKAEKDGVEGAEKVVDARETLADAQERQGDAARDLKRALEDQKRTQYDTAKAVSRAIEDLAQARKKDTASASAAATAADLYQQELNKLSPSAKKVVLGLLAMSGAWTKLRKNVQEAFFSKIVGDLKLIRDELPVVEDLFTRAASSLGKVADQGIRMITSGPWDRDFGEIAKANQTIIENIGDAVLQVADAFRSLTIEALPISKELSNDIKDLATRFNNFIQASRENGDLGEFFAKGLERLRQFGRILENVAAGFTDLVIASTDFTDWLLDGLEELTEKFKEFSREQKKAGSPFKKYLEDIKPLLKQVGSLIDAIVSSIAEIATDPKNIEHATDLLRQLEEDVLPAVVRLLDALAESGIDEAVLDAFVSILNALSSFLENGGGTGVAAFASVLGSIAKGIGAIVSIPGAAPALGAIAAALGSIAALSFIAKASGLLAMAKVIGKIVSGEGALTRIFKLITGGAVVAGAAGGRKGKGGKGGGAAGAAGDLDAIINGSLGRGPASAADKDKERKKDKRKQRRTGGRGLGGAVAAAGAQAAIEGGLDAIISRSRGKGAAGAVGSVAKSGGGRSLLGKIGGVAGAVGRNSGKLAKFGKFAGGPLSILAAIGGSVAASAIGNGQGGRRDTAAGAINGGLTGSAIGGLIGSIIPGLGTAVGAGIGGVVGAGLGAIDGAGGLDKLGEQISETLGDVGSGFSTFGDGVVDVYTTVERATSNFWKNVGNFFLNGWANAQRFNREGWTAVTNFFTSSWNFLSRQAATYWASIIGFFVGGWNQLKLIVSAGWAVITNFFTNSWNTISGIVSRGWSGVKNFFSTGFATVLNIATTGWSRVQGAFNGALTGLQNAVSGALGVIGRTWERLRTDLNEPVSFFVNTVIGTGLVGNVNKLLNFLHLPLLPVPHFAEGGRVPGTGNKDSVPAMLMPGEYVIRKKRVQEIGVDNLEAMNRGDSKRKDGAGWALPGFALGGLVPDLDDLFSGAKNLLGSAATGSKNLAKDTGQAAKDLLSDGVTTSLSTALKPVRDLLGSMSGDGISGLLKGIGTYTLNQLVSTVGSLGEGGSGIGAGKATSGRGIKAAPTNVTGNKAIVRQLAASMYGWVGGQWDALYNLIMGESGFNNNAQNPTSTAYGMFQFLNSTWAGVGARKTSDPRLQTIAGLKYIKRSYGDPIRAYSKWRARSPHWYGKGGSVATQPDSLGGSIGQAMATLSGKTGAWPRTPKASPYGSVMSDRAVAGMPGSGIDALVAMAGGGLVPDLRSAVGAVPTSALNAAATSVSNNSSVDRGFTVERIDIHNPRPEKSGESLYRTVEKLSFFGGSRG